MTDHSAFEAGAATNAGHMQNCNEDRVLIRPDLGLWAVADGMDGHAEGAAPNAAVIESLAMITRTAAGLLQACKDRLRVVNAQIRQMAARRGIDVMGTTVVALLIFDRHFSCLWSGDSHAYVIRGAPIHQITCDLTEMEELVAEGSLSGEEVRRNVVTRAIGVFENPAVDIRNGEPLPQDALLRCSDGLTGYVEPAELRLHARGAHTQSACDALIGLALEGGSQDNVTVIVVRYLVSRKRLLDRPTQWRE